MLKYTGKKHKHKNFVITRVLKSTYGGSRNESEVVIGCFTCTEITVRSYHKQGSRSYGNWVRVK